MRLVCSLIALALLQTALSQARPATETTGGSNVPENDRTAALLSQANGMDSQAAIQSVPEMVGHQEAKAAQLLHKRDDDEDEDGDEHPDEMRKNKEEDGDDDED